MTFYGLLPIGTVVLIGDSEKRVMIVGVCQRSGDDGEIWDYTGVLYPEGYLDSDTMFLFNNDQISKVFATGYQDEEQFEFKDRADATIKSLREEK